VASAAFRSPTLFWKSADRLRRGRPTSHAARAEAAMNVIEADGSLLPTSKEFATDE
jgi:hypothetical protein